MLTKRIIPCLDVANGRVVKGVNFENLKDAGDPVELAAYYSTQGADELVFLDITASHEARDTMIDVVENVAKQVFIPFTVGGGIKTVEEIKKILRAGADKVSLNSAAITNPNLISQAANAFGSQCVVLAIDAKQNGPLWSVYINGGRNKTKFDAVSWAKTAVDLGAGEILLTSIDTDGTKQGYDVTLTRTISSAVSVPVIASGGAGQLTDFADVFIKGQADAALAASLFHYHELTVGEIKAYLSRHSIPIRT